MGWKIEGILRFFLKCVTRQTVFFLVIWIIAWACFGGSSRAFSAKEDMDLGFNDDLFSANIHETSVRDILEKLNREKGVWFQGAPSVLEDKVSVQFKDLTLQQGLQRILSNMNYALFFEGGNRLVGIFIIGSKTSQGGVVPKGLSLGNKRRAGKTAQDAVAIIENPFGISVAGKGDSPKKPADTIFGNGSSSPSEQGADDPISPSPFSQNPFSGNALPTENPFGQHWPVPGATPGDSAFSTPFSSQDSSQDTPQDLLQDSPEDSSPFSP